MWPFRRKADPGKSDQSRTCPATLGARGEKLARKFLKRQGCKILARNYRCVAGEIDLIVLDKSSRPTSGAETIVFVEVKTRSSDRYTAPESAVNADNKRRHLEKASRHYLATRNAGGFNVRFDVVSIVIRPGEKPEVRHIPDAF